jgi:hypothetical protein
MIENTIPATHPELARMFPGVRFAWRCDRGGDSWSLFSIGLSGAPLHRATVAIDKGRSVDRFGTYYSADPVEYHGSLTQAMRGAESQLIRQHQNAAAN